MGKKIKNSLIILAIIILGLSFINFVNYKSINIFKKNSVELSFKQIKNEASDLNENYQSKIYKSSFNREDFFRFSNDINKIVFYRINAISYEVYVNNVLIGYMDPYEKRQGKLMANYDAYDISSGLIKDYNEVEVKATFYSGDSLNDFPIILTSTYNSYKIEKFIKHLFQIPFMLLMSLILFLLIFFIALNLKIKNAVENYIYYSGSSFFILLGFIEFSNPYALNISLIFYKKILILSFWMPVICLSYKFYQEYDIKIMKNISLSMLVFLFIPIVFGSDYILFSQLYKMILVPFFIFTLFWLYNWIKIYREYHVLKILFPFVILMYVFGFYDALNHVIEKSYNSFAFYSVLLFHVLLILVISEDYYQIYLDSIKNKEKIVKYSELVKKDSMTKVYTYEYLKEYANRWNKSYSLMILDIDSFKYINDTYGHSLGDKVILKLVKLLKDNTNDNAIISRFGGDEFVIFSPDISCLLTVSNLLEKGFYIEYGELELKINLSIGIVESEEYKNISEVFEIADKNLYTAKKMPEESVVIKTL